MKHRQERHTRRHVRQHSLSMTVNHAIDARKFLEHLAMDEPLGVTLLGIRVDSRAVRDVILNQIFGRRDDSRGHVAAHDVDVRPLGVPYGDMAVCIDDIVVVEDVICCYERATELHQLGLLRKD